MMLEIAMKTRASRPRIPDGYGVPKDDENLLPWSYVEERVTSAKHYWLSTVTPNGLPYTRPIDGFWYADRLVFGGSEHTRWRRNLARNPAACIHLEDALQAIMLHGEVEVMRPERELAERLAAASREKFPEFAQKTEDYEGAEICRFKPRVVIAWKTLYEDATRFDCSDD
jgi:hypothetical protein